MEQCTADRKYSSVQMVGLIDSDFLGPGTPSKLPAALNPNISQLLKHKKQMVRDANKHHKTDTPLICLRCEWRWYCMLHTDFDFSLFHRDYFVDRTHYQGACAASMDLAWTMNGVWIHWNHLWRCDVTLEHVDAARQRLLCQWMR